MDIVQILEPEIFKKNTDDTIKYLEKLAQHFQKFRQYLPDKDLRDLQRVLSLSIFEQMKYVIIHSIQSASLNRELSERDMKGIHDWTHFKNFITSKYKLRKIKDHTHQKMKTRYLFKKIRAMKQLIQHENTKLKQRLALYIQTTNCNTAFMCIKAPFKQKKGTATATSITLEQCLYDKESLKNMCEYIDNLKETDENLRIISSLKSHSKQLKNLSLKEEKNNKMLLKKNKMSV
eukprot:196551_1